MLTIAPLSEPEFASTSSAETRPELGSRGSIRCLAAGEILFEIGDLKSNFYRIECGSVGLYARCDGEVKVIEVAGALDYLGMGFLDRHIITARATRPARLRVFPLGALDELLKNDGEAKAQFDTALQREFTIRRDTLVQHGQGRPLVRLAAFLTALARRNDAEGGNPHLINDTFSCAVIADYLDLKLDALASALMQLETRGLVKPDENHNLHLIDINALAALAEGGAQIPELPAGDAYQVLSPEASPCIDLAIDNNCEDAAEFAEDEVLLNIPDRARPQCYMRPSPFALT